jgi:hypothetical protein
MEAYKVNGIWEVVKLPAGKHAIGSRWFLKVRYNIDGSLECYKARLVAKGYYFFFSFFFLIYNKLYCLQCLSVCTIGCF